MLGASKMTIRLQIIGIITIIVLLITSSTGCLVEGHNERTKTLTVTIDEDHYYMVEFPELSRLEWSLDYLDGEPNIDIYFMDEVNFNQYKDGNSFNYIVSLSQPDTKDASKGPVNVDSDKYYWVVDNSDRGSAAPPSDGVNNPARVYVELVYS